MRFLFPILLIFSYIFGDERVLISHFENPKQTYFNNQIIHLKLKTITAENGNISIVSDSPILEINSIKEDNSTYLSTITFQLKDRRFPIFTIYFNDENNSKIGEEKISLNSKIEVLNPPKNFSNILAKNMEVKNPVLSDYDENNNILYFNVLFNDANSRDFKFNKILDFDLIEGNKTEENFRYSAIVPKQETDFKIIYFNTIDGEYKTIFFSTKLKDETISTQTDIKPIVTTQIYLIDAVLIGLILLWILLYYYKRKWIYIILILLAIGSLIFFNLPKKEITLKTGKQIHILPFEQSTIFMTTEIPTKVTVLNRKGEYIKIEINNKIGWVKDDE